MIRILIDENIPFAQEAFTEFGEVRLSPGRAITKNMLQDVDALIVRSVTPVNATLLEGTPVRFIGTATIGIDHVDVALLRDKNIAFASAAGSNANSVAEYIMAAILEHVCGRKLQLQDLTIGVVGVGHVGRQLVRYAKALGMRVLQNDPPRQRAERSNDFISLDELMNVDIISLHTPLTKQGEDATFHLFDAGRLERLKPDALLINTSRGGVVATAALKRALAQGRLRAYLDVWENEPGIDGGLLQLVAIGTPHIAGYSYDGKVNGTVQIHHALCRFLDRHPRWQLNTTALPNPAQQRIQIIRAATVEETLRHIVQAAYDVCGDSAKLKVAINYSQHDRGRHFDELRKSYPIRREFSSYQISRGTLDEKLVTMLQTLGFEIRD